jgi:hypothetical protein
VDTGSRDEDASKQKLGLGSDSIRIEKSVLTHKSIASADVCFRAHCGLKSGIAGGGRGITSSRHHHVERASAQTTDKCVVQPLMGKFLDTRIFGAVSV